MFYDAKNMHFGAFYGAKNISRGIRTSLENFSSYDDNLVYPLYAIKNIYALSSLKVGS